MSHHEGLVPVSVPYLWPLRRRGDNESFDRRVREDQTLLDETMEKEENCGYNVLLGDAAAVGAAAAAGRQPYANGFHHHRGWGGERAVPQGHPAEPLRVSDNQLP